MYVGEIAYMHPKYFMTQKHNRKLLESVIMLFHHLHVICSLWNLTCSSVSHAFEYVNHFNNILGLVEVYIPWCFWFERKHTLSSPLELAVVLESIVGLLEKPLAAWLHAIRSVAFRHSILQIMEVVASFALKRLHACTPNIYNTKT